MKRHATAEAGTPKPMWMSRRGIAALLVAATLLHGRVAAAGDGERAEKLIRDANAFRKAGKDQKAFELLQQAYGLFKTPRTAAQLGLVEMALRYWTDAESHLGEALASQGMSWIESNRVTLEDAFGRVRSHVATLEIVGAPAGAEVAVDGRPAGALPWQSPHHLSEGDAVIEINAKGYEVWHLRKTFRGGAAETLQVQLRPTEASRPVVLAPTESVALPRTEAKEERQSSWKTKAAWVALVAGAGGLALGAAESVSWSHGVSQFNSLPGSGSVEFACGAGDKDRGFDKRCAGLYSNYRRAEFVAIGGFVAGAALLSASAVLFISTNDGPSRERTMSCAPRVASLGLDCRFHF